MGTAAGCSDPLAPKGVRAYIAVATGGDHSCAVAEGGAVYCWGRGADHQLGTGRTENEFTPAKVASDVAFTDITAGDAHTCALATDGRIFCWGWNAYYQLGHPSNAVTDVPVPVDSNVRFTALSAGAHHTCALSTDSRVYCWGYNRYGQNGNGRTQTVIVPEPVGDLRASAVSAGGFHSCALIVDGNALCWGRNDFGQLGIGTDTVVALHPTPVRTTLSFTQIDAGATHTCAVARNGNAYCWGSNEYGEIGDAAPFKPGLPGPATPAQAILLSNVQLISAGTNMSCAVQAGAHTACWGRGDGGQLANGNTANFAVRQPMYVEPQDFMAFTDLDTNGFTHACGIVERTVFCWGTGRWGQLGARNSLLATRPQRVAD